MEEPTNPVIPPRPAPASLVGTVLAERYQVLRIIAEGGMGSVYLAEHITIGRRLAVKVLSTDLGNSPEVVQRFLQEARAASMIQHEHIVDIIDFGYTQQGQAFLAMEHLEGEDLATTLEREGRLPWARLRRMVLQICRALNAAHEKGVIHRDMKPDNCFRIKRGGNADFIKLLDFGIAKVVTESGTFRGKKPVAATEAGTLLGTPEYMAPELARDCVPDARVDIYSLGVMIYELLTGVVPFKGETFMSTVAMHLTQDVVPPRQRAPSADIPPAIEAVIMRALAKDPIDRFQDIREMTEALVAADQRLRSTGLFLPAIPDTPDEAPTTASTSHAGVERAPTLNVTLQSSPGARSTTPQHPLNTGSYPALSSQVTTTGGHAVTTSSQHPSLTGPHPVVNTGQHQVMYPSGISRVEQGPAVTDSLDQLVETIDRVRPNPYRWLSGVLALVVIALGVTVWGFNKKDPAEGAAKAADASTTTPVPQDTPQASASAGDDASAKPPAPNEAADSEGEEINTDPRMGALKAITEDERRQISADLLRYVKKCAKSHGLRPSNAAQVSVGLRVKAGTGKISADIPSEVIGTLMGTCILQAVNSTQFQPGRKAMRFDMIFGP
ncbi:MAG: protein kinase [Myxococcales bacterium]|nr:protein kinase [Myxococcales bacterium]